jgi:hypothetical protein
MPTAYPLQWPAGKKRTESHRRKRSVFGGHNRSLTVWQATTRLQRELNLFGARSVVVSTNVELRLDGLPRSGQRKAGDPGVAVYFRLDERPYTLAADSYDTVEANIAAIAAHIQASRAIERHGVGTLHEIFAGFAALPPATAVDDWRGALGNPRTLAEAESTYREAMKVSHPDVAGGSEAMAAMLNAAIRRAREVLK